MSPTLESRRGGHQNRGRVIFRNYDNGDHPNSGRRRNKTLQSFRRSSMANINLVKEKFLSRRSGYYDDAKEALVKENNGIRIWYHNYTTIGKHWLSFSLSGGSDSRRQKDLPTLEVQRYRSAQQVTHNRDFFKLNFILFGVVVDWIHDFVKERVRLRHLRSLGGVRGMLKNKADGLKGWVLVLLTGKLACEICP